MTRPSIEEIKKVAEGATQANWEVQTGSSWRRIGSRGPTHWGDGDILCPIKASSDGHPDLLASEEDLNHITTMDPPTVLQLIAYIEELEAKNES